MYIDIEIHFLLLIIVGDLGDEVRGTKRAAFHHILK